MAVENSSEVLLRLGVACLGGLAVGIEREQSMKPTGAPARFAGVRTFFLLGLVGGLAGTLHESAAIASGVLTLGAVSALIVAAYALKAYRGEPDSTTEVSALVVVTAGVLAGLGYVPLASGVFAVTWLVLVEKGRIHSTVLRIQPEVLEAAARFSVLALVVLPLLPNEAYGPPPGFQPRQLWIFVLLFSGVSFVGFLALKTFGASKGYGLAGVLGGAVSSTAVTLTFSRESRANQAASRPLGLGVVAACTVVFVRVIVMALILSTSLGSTVSLGLKTIPYYALPFATGVLTCLVLLRSRSEGAPLDTPRNPLRLSAAVQMAVLFQVFLYLVEWARQQFGDSGVLLSAAVLGLTDMDALTYSMVKYAADEVRLGVASRALAIGMLSNTAVKLAIVLLLGHRDFRRVAGVGLVLLGAAGAAALVYL